LKKQNVEWYLHFGSTKAEDSQHIDKTSKLFYTKLRRPSQELSPKGDHFLLISTAAAVGDDKNDEEGRIRRRGR
jgi:hypothetical protein